MMKIRIATTPQTVRILPYSHFTRPHSDPTPQKGSAKKFPTWCMGPLYAKETL